MKAWTVTDKYGYEGYCTVVFADSSGKAKALALSTDACEDAKFVDIQCTRSPHFDKYYSKGKKEMDWNNSSDRIALVKAGWYCIDRCEDKNCPAAKWCDEYKRTYTEGND